MSSLTRLQLHGTVILQDKLQKHVLVLRIQAIIYLFVLDTTSRKYINYVIIDSHT